jgi:hypothetical protein
MEIDSLLGDTSDLLELCNECHKRNMYVVLDGVFNHVGADSIYFNKKGTYNSIGAYQSKESPYFDWFNFYNYPDLCSTPPDQGIRQAVLARHSRGMLSPPTIYRIPFFAWDAFNARTETREAFHHTRPVSLRLARCPSIDPSDVFARLLLQSRGAPRDGALLFTEPD